MNSPSAKSLVILVAVDFEPQSTFALREAVAFAARMPTAKVHAIHVVEPMRLASSTPFALVDFHREARDQLDALLEKEGLADRVTPHVHVGAPADILVRASDSLNAEVLYLGTHGRKGIERLFVGSVAEAVVRHASCTVVVARDKGPSGEELIEPACAACVAEARNGDPLARCERHRRHHPRAHAVVHDRVGVEGGTGTSSLRIPE